MAVNAAIYLRVSSAIQEDNYSLDTQEAACRRHAADHGCTVADEHIYSDVHSGAELWERGGLTRLREAIRARKVQVVIAYAIDRLSRNQHHLGLLLSEAERYGARLEFVTEQLDDTPQGKFLRAALGFVADMERDKFKERSIRGRQARLQSGKPLVGKRPLYGYAWNGDKSAYVVNEAEAAIVRRIFAEVADGKTLRSLTLTLNAENVPVPWPTRSGPNLWHTHTVQRICKQPAYWGQAKGYRYRIVTAKVTDEFSGEVRTIKRRLERPIEEQVDVSGAVPQLVDPLLAEAVAERIEHNKEVAARNNRNIRATLLRGGFIKCGYCGRNFIATGGTSYTSRNQRIVLYRCGSNGHNVARCNWHTIAAHRIDSVVWQLAARILAQPEIIARELERQHSANPAEADLSVVDHRLAEIKGQQSSLARVAALITDDDAGQPLAAQLSALAEEKRKLDAEREDVLVRHRAWDVAQQRLLNIEAWCHSVASRLDTLSYEQKREALYALGVRVTVYRRDHDPHYTIEANIPLDGASYIVSSTRTGWWRRRVRWRWP